MLQGLSLVTELRVFLQKSNQWAVPAADKGCFLAMQGSVLVIGGAGYIGSHTSHRLRERGYNVVVFDSLELGHSAAVSGLTLVQGDYSDLPSLESTLRQHNVQAVMHFGAYASVGDSVRDPKKYYENNVGGGLQILRAMLNCNVRTMIFSSSAATYGEPQQIPIPENHPQMPTNPYGETKLQYERILRDYAHAYGLESVSLRYFNAAGADPQGRIGEDHTPEQHIIPLVIDVALGRRDEVRIFGTDWETRDGTCLRDFVHVQDLADAHILALEYLNNGGKTTAYNLGNGQGHTVKEVIEAVEMVSGKKVKTIADARRPGDPARLVASCDKIKSELGWNPQFPDIETIIQHAYSWREGTFAGLRRHEECWQRSMSGSGWQRGAKIAFAIGTGVLLAFPVVLTIGFAHPPRKLHRRTPKTLGMDYERVLLRTTDGLRLAAWFVPHPQAKGVVVFCHGFTGNRSEMLYYLHFLHQAGYAGLLFDFRAHGWSGGNRVTFGHREPEDLRTAIDWVKGREDLCDLPLAVFGESMGGAVSLLVAGEDTRIEAVVADSPYSRFDTAIDGRLRHLFGNRVGLAIKPMVRGYGEFLLGVRSASIAPIEQAIKIAPRPVLLIQGTNDYLDPTRNSRLMADTMGETAVFWEVEGARHVSSRHVSRDEYSKRVVEFLDEALMQ